MTLPFKSATVWMSVRVLSVTTAEPSERLASVAKLLFLTARGCTLIEEPSMENTSLGAMTKSGRVRKTSSLAL